jgi:hypothetical protein
MVAPTFTVLNSVQPGGIHPSPLQTTGGNGALTGQEVQITLNFLTPFNLDEGHFFFVPQVNNQRRAVLLALGVAAHHRRWRNNAISTGVTDLQYGLEIKSRPRLAARREDIVGGTPAHLQRGVLTRRYSGTGAIGRGGIWPDWH